MIEDNITVHAAQESSSIRKEWKNFPHRHLATKSVPLQRNMLYFMWKHSLFFCPSPLFTKKKENSCLPQDLVFSLSISISTTASQGPLEINKCTPLLKQIPYITSRKARQLILTEFTAPHWHADNSPQELFCFKQEEEHVPMAVLQYAMRPKGRLQEKQTNYVLSYSKDQIGNSFKVLTLPLCFSSLILKCFQPC